MRLVNGIRYKEMYKQPIKNALRWFEKDRLIISVKKFKRVILATGSLLVALIVALTVYVISYQGKILPRVALGDVKVGGLSKEEAIEALENRLTDFNAAGVKINLDPKHDDDAVPAASANVELSASESAQKAFDLGRSGPWYQRFEYWLKAPVLASQLLPESKYDSEGMKAEVEAFALKHDTPRRDVRYEIKKGNVVVLTDIAEGKIVDQEATLKLVEDRVKHLSLLPITLTLKSDRPKVNPNSADESRQQAERILAAPLTLKADNKTILLEKTTVGGWITSDYKDERLVPGIDERQVAEYVGTLATQVNAEPDAVKLKVENGQIIEFEPAKSGLVLEENQAATLIRTALLDRATNLTAANEITLPLTVKQPLGKQTAAELGIKEEVGKATTPFTGSPANRIHNITLGARLLSGFIIQPGEEFSTVKALGEVDGARGFLPELVIKGDRTIPEFGGGLCQVSTTLFRAVLNAGLPVTSRQNHSYRVSYYEKDGDGRDIGPGLDATIYSPRPDFKFKNDTDAAILIQGSVKGNKVSFDLYGTRDGRVSTIDGPRTLTTIPPGDPIYADTDTLPVGTTQQIEKPHPGGQAIATYTVKYADGRTVNQTFKSSYRPWPARFLVGTKQP